jgi:hypothetical protein
MALSSGSKKSTQSDSNSDSDDEVRDELPFLHQENERLGSLLDNRDDMLRKAKKMRKKLRASLEDARTRVAKLETQVLDSKLEIDSLKASPFVSDEVDCADCSIFLACVLCQPEFDDRVHTEHLACRIWLVLKEAHVGNAQVQARMYATYQREYENFTHVLGESIDPLFQRFTVLVNNMRANVDVLPYDDHDRAVKLLHSLDCTIWGGKFEAIVESEKYDTLTMNELFSKLKSAEVDSGMTTKLEGPTDSHSLALIGGSKGKANTNPPTRMFSLSSFISMPDEEFDVLGKDELALLMRRFERLHENRVNMRRNMRTCFHCGKPGHFVADCPEKVENKDGYKHKSRMDGKYRSRRDHKSKHKNKYKDER